MKWSIEELFKGLALYREKGFWNWFVHFPRNTWERIKVLTFWIFKGYVKSSVEELDYFLLDILIYRLELFSKLKRHGRPQGFNSDEEWDQHLELLVSMFKCKQGDCYISLRPKLEPHFTDVEVLGKTLRGMSFKPTEEQRILIDSLNEKQETNNREVFEMFAKIFDSLWV